MEKLTDININKVIYDKEIYVRVNDLTELFKGVSLYKIKKTIAEMGIETVKLKGFGNGLFIREKDVNKIIIDGKSVILSTKVRVLSDEIKMTKLLNKMLTPSEEIAKQLIADKVSEFIEEDDYVIEEAEQPKAIEENKEFNKEMEENNLAYRKVFVGLKTMYGKLGVDLLIDQNSNIVGNPWDNSYEVANDKFYIGNNENYSGNPEEDYSLALPLQTGTVIVNEDKIVKQLMEFAYSNSYECDGSGGRIYANKVNLVDDDIFYLQHKDTMFTGVVY